MIPARKSRMAVDRETFWQFMCDSHAFLQEALSSVMRSTDEAPCVHGEGTHPLTPLLKAFQGSRQRNFWSANQLIAQMPDGPEVSLVESEGRNAPKTPPPDSFLSI